jgi:hypothetical protein
LKGLSNSYQRGYSDQCNKGGRYTNDELSPTLIKLFKSAIEKKVNKSKLKKLVDCPRIMVQATFQKKR